MPTGGGKPTSADLGEVLEGLLEAGIDFIMIFNTPSACGGVKRDVIFPYHGNRENIT